MFSPIRRRIDSLFRKMVFRVVVYPDYSETKGRMESGKGGKRCKRRWRKEGRARNTIDEEKCVAL